MLLLNDGICREKVMINIDKYGNTQAANPVVPYQYYRAGKVKKGEITLY
jgi:3-oxoacyl-[acyl-carrier-protein] synthase III